MLIIFLITGALSHSYCQNLNNNTGISADSTQSNTDSVVAPIDSLTSEPQTSTKPKSKKVLDSKVKYHAKDSMRFEISSKKMFLFGEADVEYENIKLKANYIELDLNSNTVYASGTPDSTGNLSGKPVFEEGGKSFASETMTYNFETKKGLIQDVITKEGDGYIHGEKVKKMSNDELFIQNGKYTTCDKPEPHFHLQVSKLKIIPNSKIITGPAYMKIGDIPTPLALPFGFFPNKKGRASGIVIPSYGENYLGFFLNNGGYYLGLSDNFDLLLSGDVYSKGSWALGTKSHYKKRYKYDGNLNMKYSFFKVGFKELGIDPKKDFIIQWNHRQDPKARPNSNFSANVNISSRKFNQLNSPASTNYLNNTMQSNIAYSKTWPGKPFNLSINGSHSQNTISKTVSVTLPQAVFNINRLYPFKSEIPKSQPRWYNQIADNFGISYVANIKNQVNTFDSLLFKNGMDQFSNGMMHNIPVSTSFKLFKFVTLSSGASYNERWYMKTIDKNYISETNSIDTDTITGFRRNFEYSANTSMSTKIYGMYQFRGKTIKAIRHVMTPSVGYAYRPDFSSNRIINKTTIWSPYDIGVFGKPGSGKQGNITYGLINNLEMKVRSSKDTLTGFKKIKIFENLSLGGSYNTLADHYKWSMISASARTNLFSNIDLNMNARFDPYALSSDTVRVEKFAFNENNKIARLTDATVALNFRLSSQNFKKEDLNPNNEPSGIQPVNPNGYVDFNVPWNLNMYFNINYNKPQRELITQTLADPQFTQSLTFSGDFSLTPKWKIGFNSGYDFKLKDFTYTTLNLYRDLHCWELKVDMVPMGVNKSYMISLGVKPGTLQDLKLRKQLRPDYSDF